MCFRTIYTNFTAQNVHCACNMRRRVYGLTDTAEKLPHMLGELFSSHSDQNKTFYIKKRSRGLDNFIFCISV
jgi:hypothetical protein